MMDADGARKRWLKERPAWEAFGKLVAHRLGEAVKARGVWSETTSRPKECHSLVKKLLRGKHTYDTLPDKVGARCVVRYLSDLDRVISVARELFECSELDSKLEKLAEDRVGYSSLHIEVRLKDKEPQAADYPPGQYCAELQVRTLGQHLWSEMTHDTLYKSEEALAALSSDIKRRANLMSGLIEVADREFDRLNRETALDPAMQLYKELERHYYKLTAKRPDAELSLEVINLLAPLYGAGVQQIAQRIGDFFARHEAVLHSVYAEAEEWNASAFLYQPEVLMIFERLEADQFSIRKVWNTRFPERELERVANAFGMSFD
jgi:ppGpp synthetase/RelA/SpoT-type nucleotidyltranferase